MGIEKENGRLRKKGNWKIEEKGRCETEEGKGSRHEIEERRKI